MASNLLDAGAEVRPARLPASARRRAAVTSLEALLASGLHTAQFQAFIEGANALPDDYPASDDYKNAPGRARDASAAPSWR